MKIENIRQVEVAAQIQKTGQIQRCTDVLSETYINEELEAADIYLKTEIREEISSTNTLLRQYAEEGERQDMLLLSEHQTGGRGRKGRSFYSPKGTGLYMSLLLHPRVPAGEVHMLTTLAAAATAKALEKISGQAVQIKWVNDILVNGKKVVGILTEASGTVTDGCFDYVIVGIGINIYEPIGGFPKEIQDVAGAVFINPASEEMVCGMQGDTEIHGTEAVSGVIEQQNLRSRVAAEVVKQFMEFYRTFPDKSYLEEYRSRSFLIGKEVRVIPTEQISNEETGAEQAITGNGQMVNGAEEIATREVEKEGIEMPVYAKVLGIDEQCRLQVRYEDGREELLSNGEVSVRER